jgi:hypothetical protein
MFFGKKYVYVLFDDDAVIGVFSSRAKLDRFLDKYPCEGYDLHIREIEIDALDNLPTPPKDKKLFKVWHMTKEGYLKDETPVEEVDFFIGWEDEIDKVNDGLEWCGNEIIGNTLIMMVLAKDAEDALRQVHAKRTQLIVDGIWGTDRRITI